MNVVVVLCVCAHAIVRVPVGTGQRKTWNSSYSLPFLLRACLGLNPDLIFLASLAASKPQWPSCPRSSSAKALGLLDCTRPCPACHVGVGVRTKVLMALSNALNHGAISLAPHCFSYACMCMRACEHEEARGQPEMAFLSHCPLRLIFYDLI